MHFRRRGDLPLVSEPSDISAGSISLWLKDSIGSLNNLILTNFSIDTASGNEIIPTLTDAEKSILKKLFLIHYYTVFISKNLGAASFDSVLEVTSDGATVRRTNKNELAKTYLQLRNVETEDLQKLINGYKSSAGTPLQVHGDDIYSHDPGVSNSRNTCG